VAKTLYRYLVHQQCTFKVLFDGLLRTPGELKMEIKVNGIPSHKIVFISRIPEKSPN
jgi:hypothetical protein